MGAGVPYYDQRGLARGAAMDEVARLRGVKRGEHDGGEAFVLPNNGGWALVSPKSGPTVRLRVYKGACPCGAPGGAR